MGYKWHSKQRKTDPDHQTCDKCKKYWRDRSYELRDRRRKQRIVIGQILVGAKGTPNEKDAREIHRLVTRYGTKEQKEMLYEQKPTNPTKRVHKVPKVSEIVVFHVQSEPGGAGEDRTEA